MRVSVVATVNQSEQNLLSIVRTLSPARVAALLNFARFLESQALAEKLAQGEIAAEIEADNARWDKLLATDEAQTLLDNLADAALAEHKAGKTKSLAFTHEGRLTPG